MYLTKAASVISFFGALVIGIAAAWVVNPWGENNVDVTKLLDMPVSRQPVSCRFRFTVLPVKAENLRGHWSGTWGYDDDPATMDIDRVEGNKFYGTLSEYGAAIAIEGTVDTERRTVTIHETKVVKLGPDMSLWSLGTDTGSFSPNDLMLSGSGNDKWGTYRWEMEKE